MHPLSLSVFPFSRYLNLKAERACFWWTNPLLESCSIHKWYLFDYSSDTAHTLSYFQGKNLPFLAPASAFPYLYIFQLFLFWQYTQCIPTVGSGFSGTIKFTLTLYLARRNREVISDRTSKLFLFCVKLSVALIGMCF